MPTYRDQPCCLCGKLVHKRVRHDRPIYCRKCAAQRTADVANQLGDKQGEAYENWLAGQREWIDQQIRKAGMVGHSEK